MNITEIKELLKDTTVFSLLSDEELAQLASRVELVHYPLGQPVRHAGDKLNALFIVYSGRARVVSENAFGQEVTLSTLTRGNFFGEQGLLADAPSEHTVRSAGDLALLRLGKPELERWLMLYPHLREYFEDYANETSLFYFLGLCNIFAPLSPAEIRGLLRCLEVREYPAGQFVYREGEPGDALYILRSGGVRIIQASQQGKVISHLQPGDAFGLSALLLEQPRATSAVTKEAASVFRLERSEFNRLSAASPAFKEALINFASGYNEGAVRATAPLPPRRSRRLNNPAYCSRLRPPDRAGGCAPRLRRGHSRPAKG